MIHVISINILFQDDTHLTTFMCAKVNLPWWHQTKENDERTNWQTPVYNIYIYWWL